MKYITYVLLVLIVSVVSFILSCQLLWDGDSPYIDGITNIHITVSEDGLERLYDSVFYGDYVFCWYQEDDLIYPGSIKVRGDFSRQSDKKSFTVRVEKPGGEIRYAFTGSYYDPSALRNRIALETYRAFGLPSPETKGTALFINNHYIGYYTRINLYTEEALASFYSVAPIELFDCKFKNMGSDIPLQGLSEKRIPKDNDFSSLNRLLIQLTTLSDEEWNNWVAENVDIESTSRYLVIHNFLAVMDTSNKNFYIALSGGNNSGGNNSGGGIYFYLPWDHEACMRRGWRGNYQNSNTYNFFGNNILSKRLLAEGNPVRERYDELLHTFFLSDSTLREQIRSTITSYYAEIDSSVYYEQNRYTDYQDFLDEYDVLMLFLDERTSEFTEN